MPHEVIAVEANIAVVADETLQPSAQAEGVSLIYVRFSLILLIFFNRCFF